MSESRDTGEGPDDKEAKRRKYSDPKRQQEGEKTIPRRVSEYCSSANPSSKEHTETGRKQEEEKTEGSSGVALLMGYESDFQRSIEQRIAKLFGEENTARPVLPLKKRELHRTPRGYDQNLVFSLEESGDSSEDSSPIDHNEPVGVFLFEIQLKPSNRLVIPEAKASEYFPTRSTFSTGNTFRLRITDRHNKDWETLIIYYADEKAYMFIRGWTELANWHKWDSADVIGFYRPIPRLSIRHFLVKLKRTKKISPVIPEFRRENFLFQIELETGDLSYSRLFMPSKEVEIHFPAIKHNVSGSQTKKEEIVRFTDGKNKDWYMDVICYDAKSYMIIREWDEFVKEHNLEAGDLIRFYKLVEPLHLRHFLIEIVRKEAGRNLSLPGGGGPGGSGSYKGKEKVADGYIDRQVMQSVMANK